MRLPTFKVFLALLAVASATAAGLMVAVGLALYRLEFVVLSLQAAAVAAGQALGAAAVRRLAMAALVAVQPTAAVAAGVGLIS